MKAIAVIKLLSSLSPTLPIRVKDGNDMFFIGQVYHEPPHTFIQGSVKENRYSTVQALLERLNKINDAIPFDVDIVSGDDWNYQEINVAVTDAVVIIELSPPDF